MSSPDPWDFSDLLRLDRSELFVELAAVQSELAQLHVEIAYVSQSGTHSTRGTVATMKGERDAYIEKKWLIKALIDK